MKLRDHSLMCYRGVSNWPPVWVGRNAKPLPQLRGEKGVLKSLILSKAQSDSRFYVVMEQEGENYLGTLLFDTKFVCHQMYRLLLNHCGELIRDIGEIDVPELGNAETTKIQRRICKVCGSLDNCDFKVMDDIWRSAVPIEYQKDVLCIKCFEAFAAEEQIKLLSTKWVSTS